MKRLSAVVVLVFLLLSGCNDSEGIKPGMDLRNQLHQANGCRFTAIITADYGEYSYTFRLDCSSDQQGNVRFCVVEPESIQGITGTIDASGGKLTFEGQILAFPMIADDQITPVSAPWLLIRSIRGGYISAGGTDGEYYKLQLDDSYEEDPLQLVIWLDSNNMPIHCDILWRNRRILTAEIENFAFL